MTDLIDNKNIDRIVVDIEIYLAHKRLTYEEFCAVVNRLVAMTTGRGKRIEESGAK